MGSTRAEGRADGAVPRAEADLVAAAAALRWARPDLTAELADHVLEEASAAGQQDRWLAAAGWAVHARAATGDGRDTACAVIDALSRWSSDALAGASAHRLRVELAMVAAGAGEVEFARRLLAGVSDDGDPELAADVLCAHARCAVEDAPDEVAVALDAADTAWALVGGPAGELGGASVALIRAVVERRAGRPAAAVDHAANGLGRLERGRTGSGSPSGHLAAALAAEWISALLDAGRATEARDGCSALLPRLSEQTRPTRQLALLRLTVTRALAAQDAGADTTQLLEQAAQDAAGSDVPDLEAVCRTALGALHEQASRLDVALETLQLAVGAERRDRDRSRRFAAALAALPAEPARAVRRRERTVRPATTGDSETTTVLPAITRGDRKLRTNKREDHERIIRGTGERRRDDSGAGERRAASPAAERATSRFERMLEGDPPAGAETAAEERSTAWDAVPWNGSADESPIGDLLLRSLRDRSTEPPDSGAGRRNGKRLGGSELPSDDEPARTNNGRVPHAESTEPPADSRSGRAGRRRAAEPSDAPSGWIPSLDSDRAGERRAPRRRRGRSSDAVRRRTIHSDTSREEWDEATYPDNDPPISTNGAGESERAGRRASDRQQDSRRWSRHGSAEDGPEDGPEDRAGNADAFARDEPATGADPSDPLAAGRWSVRPDSPGDADPVPAANDAGDTPAGTSSSGGGDSDGWLQSALAELDRALSGIGVGKPAQLGEPAQLEDGPHDDGCAVVVDIARDGRRFAGPRAAAVVRSVADLLADRLPDGARSRFGDSDVLVITEPGWRRSDATDWMHRTLPALLDGFVATEELPGAQLRVAVHDADGPVGAQILQPLAPPDRERESAAERRRGDDDHGRDPWADHTARDEAPDDPEAGDSEVRGRKYRAAAQASRPERGAGTRTRREVESEPAEQPAGDDGPPRWPWSGADGQVDVEGPPDEHGDFSVEASDPASDVRSSGRHDADRGRSAVSARGEAGTRSSRHRAGAEERTSDSRESRPSRASRRREKEASGTEAVGTDAPDTGRADRRAQNDGRETGRDGADHRDGTSGGDDRGGRGGATAVGSTPNGAREASGREPDRPESTDGLGIADLLAGALAAYRGI